MQSLCAMAHFDFNLAGAYSYEQALMVMRQIGLDMHSIDQQFRRMVFNVMARNQDDHVKNIAFLMDKKGNWSLSPAFDMTYACNPAGLWTSRHQMTLNGKRDHFTRDDLMECAQTASMKRGQASRIIREVAAAVSKWRDFVDDAGVKPEQRDTIHQTLLLELCN